MGRDGRSFAAVYVALTSSSIGHTMLTVGLGLHVYDITRREFDLGALGLASWLPVAGLVLITGSVVDRFERRRVVAVSLVGGAAVSVGLAWYAATDPDSVGPIFVLVVAYGVTRSFVNPAMTSLLADVVRGDELPSVIARGEICNQGSFIIAPILGGALFVVDPRLTYAAVAGFLAAGAVVTLAIRTGPSTVVTPEAIGHELEAVRPVASRLSDALEGLRLIRANPVIAGAISLDLFAVLLGGALVLLPAIAEERLGAGPIGVGWLRAAVGIGAALPMIWFAARPLQRHIGRQLLRMVGVFGVATIALGLTTSFAVAFVAMLVLSGADAVSVFIRKTLVPLVTPSEKRGRVIAFEQLFVGASNELGGFKSGVVAQLIGPGLAVALGGVATVGVVAAWGTIFPALRDLDRFVDGRTAPTPREGALGQPAA